MGSGHVVPERGTRREPLPPLLFPSVAGGRLGDDQPGEDTGTLSAAIPANAANAVSQREVRQPKGTAKASVERSLHQRAESLTWHVPVLWQTAMGTGHSCQSVGTK